MSALSVLHCQLMNGKPEHSHGNMLNLNLKKTMKKHLIFLASAALVIAASCNKEEIKTAGETELITVQLNPETKTALGAEGTTTWDADDKVSVTVNEKVVGTLSLVEGSTFSGEITAGLSGEAILNYPAGVTAIPEPQAAVNGSFADGAALLEGTTTVEDLRAGEGVELKNKTALLKFTVAQAGDVTFEVGTAKYTVTGCKTGETYYACVAPAANVSFVARIGGYLSKKTSANVTFEANKIANLEALPAPVASDWGLVGQHQGWSLKESDLTRLYKENNNLFVVKNIKLASTGFKFTELKNTNWDLTFGSHSGDYKYDKSHGWYTGIYTNNRGDKSQDIKVNDWSKTYDVYLRFVQDANWGKELGFSIVEAGQPYPTY